MGEFDDLGNSGDDARRGELLNAAAALVDVGALRREVAEVRTQVDQAATDLQGLAALPGAVSDLHDRVERIGELAGEVQDLADVVERLAEEPTDQPRVIDLAHIAPDERAHRLTELAEWLRDVVYPGWPWVQERLRPCWILHPGIVNDVLYLRAAYTAAYEDPAGRAHHAADWRRWLIEVTLDVEETTRSCPQPGSGEWDPARHSVALPPRDDTDVVAIADRTRLLAQIHTLLEQADQPGRDPMLAEQARQRVRDLLTEHHISEDEYQRYTQALHTSHAEATRRQQARRSTT